MASSNDHTLYIREGHVGASAESNKNPGAAQASQNSGGSTIGTSIKAAGLIQAGKQVMNSTIQNIGFMTGNYDLQETAETIVTAAGIGVAMFAAPIPTMIGLGISAIFEGYANGVRQQRAIYGQQQQQVLTGKITVNGGRYQ